MGIPDFEPRTPGIPGYMPQSPERGLGFLNSGLFSGPGASLKLSRFFRSGTEHRTTGQIPYVGGRSQVTMEY